MKVLLFVALIAAVYAAPPPPAFGQPAAFRGEDMDTAAHTLHHYAHHAAHHAAKGMHHASKGLHHAGAYNPYNAYAAPVPYQPAYGYPAPGYGASYYG